MDDGEQITYVELPSLACRQVSGSWNLPGVAADGTLVLHSPTTEWLYLARPGASEPEILHEGRSIEVRVAGDDVFAWDYDWDREVEEFPLTTGRSLRIPLDGGAAETLVDDVHQPLGLTDGRWVSARDQDASDRGDLWVVDPESAGMQLVDRGVDLHFARISGSANMFPTEALHPADEPSFYTIREAGDRTGLWRATLTPR